MLAALPLLAFLLVWFLISLLRPQWRWRLSFLRAAIIVGVYTVLITELLSLINGINRLGLTVAWGLPTLLIGGWIVARYASDRSRIQFPSVRFRGFDRVVLVGIGIVIGITALIALLAPPQTWDALIYRVTRVAHWAQETSVRPFASGIELQNSRPPWAEFAMLQLYVLLGGDRLLNFVQWTAMLGGLIGISLIAARLGLGRSGQLMTVAFAASLPAGIVQASNTMNDYVVAFWMVCVAAEAVGILTRSADRAAFAFASLAGGLALATKPTAGAYLLPMGVLIGVLMVRQLGLPRAARIGIACAILFLAPNLGYLMRNTQVYGSPLNPAELVEHGDQPRNLRTLTSNFLRNAALQAGTPSPHFNKLVTLGIQSVHRALDIDINDPRTTSTGRFRVFPPSTNENLASNPLHALLIVVAGVLLLVRPRKFTGSALIYAIAVFASTITFSLIFRWQFFGGRYHLPFFVLAAPIAGLLLSHRQARFWGRIIVIMLFASAIPWLFQIKSRPLIPNPSTSYVDSILLVPREDLYLASGQYLDIPYSKMASAVNRTGCKALGIMISGNTPEYPIWVKLGAPDPALRIEWIVAGTDSTRYADEGFTPCAVICQDCSPDQAAIRNLPLNLEYADFRLYAVDD